MIMIKNELDDIIIDTIHNLRKPLEQCITGIDEADASNPTSPIINAAEQELHKLNLETNKIYSNMIADAIERRETKELIDSKKENT